MKVKSHYYKLIFFPVLCVSVFFPLNGKSQILDHGLFNPFVFSEATTEKLHDYFTKNGWSVDPNVWSEWRITKHLTDNLWAGVDISNSYNDEFNCQGVSLILKIYAFDHHVSGLELSTSNFVEEGVLKSAIDPDKLITQIENLITLAYNYQNWDRNESEKIELTTDSLLVEDHGTKQIAKYLIGRYPDGRIDSALSINELLESEYFFLEYTLVLTSYRENE